MLQIAKEHFQKEWHVIKQAPLAFFISFLALAIIIFLGIYWIFSENLRLKDDALTSKDSIINSQIINLKMKDDLITTYMGSLKAAKASKDYMAFETEKIEGLTEIKNCKYSNETIKLDGYSYIDCEFEAVTLLFNGGDFGLTGVKFIGFPTIKTTSPGSANMLRLLGNLGAYKDSFKSSYTEIKSSNIISYPKDQ